jgi:hypothetical protein
MTSNYYAGSGMMICEVTQAELDAMHQARDGNGGVGVALLAEIDAAREEVLRTYTDCRVEVRLGWTPPRPRGVKPMRVS